MKTPTESRALRRILLILALAGIALACFCTAAQAEIYKYVDRNGVSHYSDSVSSIPDEYRSQVRDITDEMDRMDGFRVIEGVDGEQPATSDDAHEPDTDLDLSGIDFEGADMAKGLLESFGFGIVVLVLLAIPILWVVSALIFKLACRMAGEEPPGLGRACGILLAQSLCGSAVGAAVGGVGALLGVDDASISGAISVGGASSILSWMANAGILVSMMSYGFVKSLGIGLLHTLLTLVMVGAPIGVIVAVAMMTG